MFKRSLLKRTETLNEIIIYLHVSDIFVCKYLVSSVGHVDYNSYHISINTIIWYVLSFLETTTIVQNQHITQVIIISINICDNSRTPKFMIISRSHCLDNSLHLVALPDCSYTTTNISQDILLFLQAQFLNEKL